MVSGPYSTHWRTTSQPAYLRSVPTTVTAMKVMVVLLSLLPLPVRLPPLVPPPLPPLLPPPLPPLRPLPPFAPHLHHFPPLLPVRMAPVRVRPTVAHAADVAAGALVATPWL